MKATKGKGPNRSSRVKRSRHPEPWERQILALIAEQRAIPMDLLAQLLEVSPQRAARVMEDFADSRWVEVRKFITADEPWVWLKRAGRAHVGWGQAKAPSPYSWNLPHHRAVAAVRVKLESEHPDGSWECEYKVRKRRRSFDTLPDAVFETRGADGARERWAVEAELSRKTPLRYRAIVADHSRRYDRVLYFCTPAVARLLGRIPAVAKNPKVEVVKFFKDPRQLPNFQWAWSAASGPNETSSPREPEAWEIDLLRLIGEQSAMSVDHLARFMGCDRDRAQRVADHLDRGGLIRQGLGPVEDPAWIWLTQAGARLAGTGLRYWEPTPLSVETLRLMNEARLHVAQRDPDVQWWSMRLLRRGAAARDVPAAVVETGGQQHAIEIEIRPRKRNQLVSKYGRRCREFDAVAVFCRPRRVASLERLKRERGWTNLYVQEFQPVDRRLGGGRKERPGGPVPYVEADPADLPPEVLKAVQEAEGGETAPRVRFVSRAHAPGARRWRVRTDSGEWRVSRLPRGCVARPWDDAWELADPPPPRWAKDPPGVMVDIEPFDLPPEVLEAIRKRIGLACPPTVVSASKRPGRGSARWRVETDHDTWRVTRHRGLRVELSD